MATGPGTPLEQFGLHLPEFLQTGSSRDIPPTVTAQKWDATMPVAFEPVPTPRRQPSRRAQIAAAEAAEEEKAAAAAVGGDQEKASSASLNRRATMPSKKALSMMAQSPPILYPSLTPSCERCETDDDELAIHCAAVFCAECDLWLCGSDPIEDGMPSTQPAAEKAKPMECNYRLHRHAVMQGHVRIPASTAMQLEKRVALEQAKQDPSQRKTRKQLLLELFALPMNGIVWQYESLQRESLVVHNSKIGTENLKAPATWIDFDAGTQNLLETTFVAAGPKAAKLPTVQIGEQYEVTCRHGEQGSSYQMVNTLTRRQTVVRRLADLDALRSSTLTASLPNSRPSSAAVSRANSRAASRATSPTASRRGSALTVGGRLALDVSAQSVGGRSGLTSPVVFPTSSVSTPTSTANGHGVSPLASARLRPALQRHASLDEQQIYRHAEWTEDQWKQFAKEQKKLAPGAPATRGHEQEDIADDRAKEFLHPLFDMERGNPLLLAVYNNSFLAVLSLLKKGYSANSVTSWTRLTALQLACMNGNTEIAECLLDNGANPAAKGTTSTMALEYAVKSGQVKLVELLLKLRHAPAETESSSSAATSDLSQRCCAYSDLLLREKRKNRRKKRSTWIDIAAEVDGDEDDEASIKTSTSSSAAKSKSNESKPPEAEDFGIGEARDRDAHLYPHLLTEALNVPPLLAHTTGVLELLLDGMLVRARTLVPPPAFELSRYHEWLSSVVSSASVERLQFLLANRARYTAHLEPLESISQDFSENLTEARYAHSVLRPQQSVDALLFQACQTHPASAQDDEEEDAAVLESNQPGSPVPLASRATSHPFAMLLLLVQHGADLNHIETDASDGTQLTPLFMAMRDRKSHLVRWLVEYGASVSSRLRVVRLDHQRPLDGADDDEVCVEVEGSPHWFRRLGWERYCLEECAFAPEEVEEMRGAIDEGLAQRRTRAKQTEHTTKT